MKTPDRIRVAIIHCWASGRPATHQSVADATAGVGASPPLAAKTVGYWMDRWTREGVAEVQENRLRQGRSIIALTADPPGTLADVLDHARTHGPGSHSRRVASAVRLYLGLRPALPLPAVLEAAGAVGAEELHALPERLQEAGRQSGLATSTVAPMVSDVRKALREAALAGRVAVILPRHHPRDAWEEACRTWFLDDDGATVARQTRQTYASNLLRLRDFLDADVAQRGPRALSRAFLEGEAYPAMQASGLGPAFEAGVRTALRYAGRTHGEGPYAALHETPRHGGVEGYLPVPRGQSENWDAVLQAMKDAGFQPCVLDFLEWHFAYSTLPDHVIEVDPGFPTRPGKRHLTANSLRHRTVALRALAFQILRLQATRPFELTLVNVLGYQGVEATRALESWWAQRAAAGEVASSSSNGLQQMLIQIGMLATTARERVMHCRSEARQARAQRRTWAPPEGVSLAKEALAAFRALQRHVKARATHLAKRRKQSPSGNKKTDVKDIRRIFRKTPPAFWKAVNDSLQEEVLSWSGPKRYRYHVLVQAAFTHAFLMTTGCRGAELAWPRLSEDLGYGPELRAQRKVEWTAASRKNRRAHAAHLREAILPAWLERLYVEETRPFLMERAIQKGTLARRHDFLFLTPSTGRPLTQGWYPRLDDDWQQAGIRVRKGVQALRCRWEAAASQAAARRGLEWPTRFAEGGLHAVRNSMAAGLFQRFGVMAAANFLGDAPESVLDTYGTVDGTLVDVSALDAEAITPLAAVEMQGPEATKPVTDPPEDLTSENRRLREELAALRQALGIAPAHLDREGASVGIVADRPIRARPA